MSQTITEDLNTDEHEGLFAGDEGDADAATRTVITYLAKYGELRGHDEHTLWSALEEGLTAIRRHFHNMYIDLRYFPDHKIAFTQQVTPEVGEHYVLLRSSTLTREAAALVLHAHNRLAAAVPGQMVVLTRTEARGAIEPFAVTTSNRVRFEQRVNGAVDTLIKHRLLARIGDGEWEISPLLPLLFTQDALTGLSEAMTAPDQQGTHPDDGDDGEDDTAGEDLDQDQET